jgi:hypothetical protein
MIWIAGAVVAAGVVVVGLTFMFRMWRGDWD